MLYHEKECQYKRQLKPSTVRFMEERLSDCWYRLRQRLVPLLLTGDGVDDGAERVNDLLAAGTH